MPLLLTSLLISLIAALCVWVMGRKDPCGRPWLTTLCLGLLLFLPLLWMLPKIQVDIVTARQGAMSTHSFWGMAEVVTAIWGGVVVLLGLKFVFHRWQLQRWLGDTDVVEQRDLLNECVAMLGMKKAPALKLKSGLTSPVVSGVWKPVIILPTTSVTWNEETQKMAILHELGHIQRRDLWVRFAADLACVLHWYNPLVWWLRAKLLSQCEYACDALIISSGADRRSYINALCDVVESCIQERRPQGLVAMADHAPLQLRVNRLLGGVNPGKSWLAIAAAIMTSVTAFGLSLVRPADVLEVIDAEPSVYSQEEIDLRHSANPFPGE